MWFQKSSMQNHIISVTLMCINLMVNNREFFFIFTFKNPSLFSWYFEDITEIMQSVLCNSCLLNPSKDWDNVLSKRFFFDRQVCCLKDKPTQKC